MNNQMIKPTSINFTELVNNNPFKLSNNFQSKMITHLEKEFSDKEQNWFIANLYVYLNYHSTNEFPINLENIYRIIGFATKANAKRTLNNNFNENEDYKVLLSPKDEQKKPENRGGHNEEEIMLNIDTFKNLCMMAKTDKGKEIRKYYVKLENIFNKISNEERLEYEEKSKLHEIQIKDQQKVIEDKSIELNKTNISLTKTKKQLEDVSRLKVKKWYDSEPGDMVYCYIDKNTSFIKLGKTEHISRRESDYMTANQEGEIVYAKKCYNCHLTEKILLHLLDKHRVQSNREFFEITKELAIYTIDIACIFLDGFIQSSEKLVESSLLQDLCNVKEYLGGKKINTEIVLKTIDNIIIEDFNVNLDPYNYDKFINEACEFDPTYKSAAYDLLGCFRIWSRGLGTNQKTRETFSKYMKAKFPYKQVYIKEYGGRLSLYHGIKPKEFVYKPDDDKDLKSYEKFILENCHFCYSFRVSYVDFIEEYTRWLNKDLDKDEQLELKAYINNKFLIDRINSDEYTGPGIWSMQLKKNNKVKYGLSSVTRRKIIKIDAETKEIILEYPSVYVAAQELGMNESNLSQAILKQRLIQNKYILQYVTTLKVKN